MRNLDGAWRRAVAPLAGVLLLLATVTPVAAAPNELSQGSVTPTKGTTATVFVFSVRYSGSPATSVRAVAGNTVVTMALQPPGTASNGTYRGSATLPAGSWSVTFQATAEKGKPSVTLQGPPLTVTQASPTPGPTTQPTAVPTPAPTSAPTSAPSSPPRPPAPTNPPIAPTPVLVSQGPGPGSPAASFAASPQTSGFIGGVIVTPRPTRTPVAGPAGGRLDPQDEIWTIVAGGLVGTALLVMLAMLAILRDRRRQATEVRLAGLPPEAAAASVQTELPADAPGRTPTAAALPGRPRAEWEDYALDDQPVGTVEYEPPPPRSGD
ncbi:MAG: hypothetical protein ACRDHD_06420 [Candidatus Limnocylindria bacterium]